MSKLEEFSKDIYQIRAEYNRNKKNCEKNSKYLSLKIAQNHIKIKILKSAEISKRNWHLLIWIRRLFKSDQESRIAFDFDR